MIRPHKERLTQLITLQRFWEKKHSKTKQILISITSLTNNSEFSLMENKLTCCSFNFNDTDGNHHSFIQIQIIFLFPHFHKTKIGIHNLITLRVYVPNMVIFIFAE